MEATLIDNSSGIYSIVNLVNNKMYVGSAVNLRKRKNKHIEELKKKKHHSNILQRAFNKYGQVNFSFDLIENVKDKDKLIEREQYWMNFFNPEYNACKVAGSQLGEKRSEKTKDKMKKAWENRLPMSEETKMKLSKAQTGKKASAEVKQKMSEKRKGEKNAMYNRKHSEETKQKMRKPKVKRLK